VEAGRKRLGWESAVIGDSGSRQPGILMRRSSHGPASQPIDAGRPGRWEAGAAIRALERQLVTASGALDVYTDIRRDGTSGANVPACLATETGGVIAAGGVQTDDIMRSP
jgi:hypothetical protein